MIEKNQRTQERADSRVRVRTGVAHLSRAACGSASSWRALRSLACSHAASEACSPWPSRTAPETYFWVLRGAVLVAITCTYCKLLHHLLAKKWKKQKKTKKLEENMHNPNCKYQNNRELKSKRDQENQEKRENVSKKIQRDLWVYIQREPGGKHRAFPKYVILSNRIVLIMSRVG